MRKESVDKKKKIPCHFHFFSLFNYFFNWINCTILFAVFFFRTFCFFSMNFSSVRRRPYFCSGAARCCHPVDRNGHTLYRREGKTWTMFMIALVYFVYMKSVTPQQMYYNYSKDIINHAQVQADWLIQVCELRRMSVLGSHIKCDNDYKNTIKL